MTTKSHFSELYSSLGLQEHSSFLLELLENDKSIRDKFLTRYKKESEIIRLSSKTPEYRTDESLSHIEDEANNFKEELEDLDLENLEWDSYPYTRDYVPEYEIANELAEDEANRVFSAYHTALKSAVDHGNLLDITTQLSIIFHGALTADINDPDYNLGDPPSDYFISETNTLLEGNQSELTIRKFKDTDFQQSIDLIFAFNNKNYDADVHFLEAILKFLFSIINTEQKARWAWDIMQKYNVRVKQFPKLLNHVTSLLNNEKLWIESLESCFLNDYETSIKLMDYYYQNDLQLFEDKAIFLAEGFESRATNYLIDKVKKGTTLHIKLLNEKAGAGNYEYFVELKNYIDITAQINLINSIDSSNTKAKFYAKESMFNELEELINKEQNNRSYYFQFFDFKAAIKGLLKIRPEKSWQLIENEISITMRGDRKRETYKYIAQLLKMSSEIAEIAEKANFTIDKWFNHQPRLPALKDEFKKAGIV